MARPDRSPEHPLPGLLRPRAARPPLRSPGWRPGAPYPYQDAPLLTAEGWQAVGLAVAQHSGCPDPLEVVVEDGWAEIGPPDWRIEVSAAADGMVRLASPGRGVAVVAPDDILDIERAAHALLDMEAA